MRVTNCGVVFGQHRPARPRHVTDGYIPQLEPTLCPVTGNRAWTWMLHECMSPAGHVQSLCNSLLRATRLRRLSQPLFPRPCTIASVSTPDDISTRPMGDRPRLIGVNNKQGTRLITQNRYGTRTFPAHLRDVVTWLVTELKALTNHYTKWCEVDFAHPQYVAKFHNDKSFQKGH